jgi:hypothetical protein
MSWRQSSELRNTPLGKAERAADIKDLRFETVIRIAVDGALKPEIADGSPFSIGTLY